MQYRNTCISPLAQVVALQNSILRRNNRYSERDCQVAKLNKIL